MDNLDDFDLYAVEVDGDCVNNDFDDYDLYGERMVSDEEEELDISFE